MVEHFDGDLDSVFRALSDGTRRAMLARLATGERTVSELAEPFAMSLAAASKHVKVLESAKLIRRMVRGRVHTCSIDAAPLAAAERFLRNYERFWTERLDTLTELLERQRRPQ